MGHVDWRIECSFLLELVPGPDAIRQWWIKMQIDIDKVSNGALGQISLLLFRGMIIVLLAIIGFFGQRMYDKSDNAEPRTEYMQQTKAQWEAIGKVTLSAQNLVTTVTQLATRFEDHVEAGKSLTIEEADHENRIRLLEANKRNPPN